MNQECDSINGPDLSMKLAQAINPEPARAPRRQGVVEHWFKNLELRVATKLISPMVCADSGRLWLNVEMDESTRYVFSARFLTSKEMSIKWAQPDTIWLA